MGEITDNIFGLRIRRASDLVGEQGREAFWRTGVELDAKLISMVAALYEAGGMTSSELAETTGLSRQVEAARLKSLERDGYVDSKISKEDARKRLFFLTRRRRKDVEGAVRQMVDFEAVYEDLWDEIGVDLGAALLKLEQALHAKPLLARLVQKFPEYGDFIKVRSNER